MTRRVRKFIGGFIMGFWATACLSLIWWFEPKIFLIIIGLIVLFVSLTWACVALES